MSLLPGFWSPSPVHLPFADALRCWRALPPSSRWQFGQLLVQQVVQSTCFSKPQHARTRWQCLDSPAVWGNGSQLRIPRLHPLRFCVSWGLAWGPFRAVDGIPPLCTLLITYKLLLLNILPPLISHLFFVCWILSPPPPKEKKNKIIHCFITTLVF